MSLPIDRKTLRNGVIAAVTASVLLLLAVSVPPLVFRARTHSYTAEFANAAGLTSGTQVDVAGVPAGRVTAVELAGDRVRVSFRLDRKQPLGNATRVAIKIRTVLGNRYLEVQPAGSGQLDEDRTIPLARTSVPYSLDEIGRGATSTTSQLDMAGLQRMIGTLQQAMPSDPRLTGEALNGISSAAQILGQRGQQIDQLLAGTQTLTATLLSEQHTLETMLGDAQIIADVLNQRRATIRQLISDIDGVTAQLDQLLRNNHEQLDPLLNDMHSITDALARNDREIAETLRQIGPTSRYVANASGNGPWGDVAAPLGPIPDNVLCLAGLLQGCR